MVISEINFPTFFVFPFKCIGETELIFWVSEQADSDCEIQL